MNFFRGYDKRKARRVEDETINASQGVLNVVRIPKKLKSDPYALTRNRGC